jgi:hypothetical protein
MALRAKRTYKLSERTLERVRELAGRYAIARSQDAVVDLAVDHLYREVREHREGELWSVASADEAFRAEVDAIARELEDGETWPT